LTDWDNWPTGGASSGEVIAVLLVENSLDSGLDGQNGGAAGGARFQCLVGVSGILERKALIDLMRTFPEATTSNNSLAEASSSSRRAM
jgi:hypothetical protein